MKRAFDKRQRRILAWIAAGKCHRCSSDINKGFHADHVIPFSRGGETVTMNGQALCSACNLSKGAK